MQGTKGSDPFVSVRSQYPGVVSILTREVQADYPPTIITFIIAAVIDFCLAERDDAADGVVSITTEADGPM